MLQILKCILGNVMVIIRHDRHDRAEQKSDYSKKIWYDCMMQYYTSVIIVFYKLKNKHTDNEF